MPLAIHQGAFHVILWQMRFGDDTVKVNVAELAGLFDVQPKTITRLLQRLVDAGRLRALNTGQGPGGNTYEVLDPAGWPET